MIPQRSMSAFSYFKDFFRILFFSEIEKNWFEDQQCILEFKTLCHLKCDIFMNKYMQKIIWPNI